MASLQIRETQRPTIYDKLPTPKAIRLLTIFPGRFGDIVHCNIDAFEFEQAPPYEALSYVWGIATPPYEIICNGQSVHVQPNLGAALQRLRYQEASKASMLWDACKPRKIKNRSKERRVWIDALCINQADLEERSQQVSFMKEIFQRAENVVVWLGEDHGYASKAIRLIRKVTKIARKEGDSTNPDRLLIPFEPVGPRFDLPADSHPDWDPVVSFYENTWFRRVWVIQEVARENRENISMVMGCHRITWPDVAICAEWINNRWRGSLRGIEAVQRAMLIFYLRRGSSLRLLFTTTSIMEATDPRDKIYALLGLYTMPEVTGESLAPFPKPDYSKTVVSVYSSFIRYLLSMPKQPECPLSLILRNETYVGEVGSLREPENSDDDDFPSWIPRWDKSLPLWRGLAYDPCAPLWKPSGDSPIIIGNEDNSKVLILRGARITTIAHLERGFELPAIKFTHDNTVVKKTLEMAAGTAYRYIGDEARKEALASTLTAGKSKMDDRVAPYNKDDLEAYLIYGARSEEGRHFAEKIQTKRTIFTTESGHMGIGSRKMQIGDQVCVLFGGEVLFILRPVEEHYRLVGECYVHGFMQGEVMEQVKAGELKSQWFELH